MRQVDLIVIHHTATRSGTVTWEQIREYHTKVKGWKDIGYHYGVVKNRKTGLYEVVEGRSVEEIGAHAKGFNENSIGIAFEGNFEKEFLERSAFEVGLALVESLMKRFRVSPKRVLGHRELPYPTLCPGFRFPLNELRGKLTDIAYWSLR